MEVELEKTILQEIVDDPEFYRIAELNRVEVIKQEHGLLLKFPAVRIQSVLIQGMIASISGNGFPSCAKRYTDPVGARSGAYSTACECNHSFYNRLRDEKYDPATHKKPICVFLSQLDIGEAVHPHLSYPGERMCADQFGMIICLLEKNYSRFFMEAHGIMASCSVGHTVHSRTNGKIMGDKKPQQWKNGELGPITKPELDYINGLKEYDDYDGDYDEDEDYDDDEDNLVECSQCGFEFAEDDIYPCEHCGQLLCPECGYETADGGVICNYCAENNNDIFGICRGCNVVYRVDSGVFVDPEIGCNKHHYDGPICQRCFEYAPDFVKCPECGNPSCYACYVERWAESHRYGIVPHLCQSCYDKELLRIVEETANEDQVDSPQEKGRPEEYSQRYSLTNYAWIRLYHQREEERLGFSEQNSSSGPEATGPDQVEV